MRPATTSSCGHPTRASGYTPSALVHRNRVYLVHDTGTMLVLAADTGREIYKARVGGVGHVFGLAHRDGQSHLLPG